MKTAKKFSLKTVVLLAHLSISIMERVHNKGVVHRDLKPENILLAREGDPQVLYLVDFGISKTYRDASNRHM
jgi:serine/threonine protein kinase